MESLDDFDEEEKLAYLAHSKTKVYEDFYPRRIRLYGPEAIFGVFFEYFRAQKENREMDIPKLVKKFGLKVSTIRSMTKVTDESTLDYSWRMAAISRQKFISELYSLAIQGKIHPSVPYLYQIDPLALCV